MERDGIIYKTIEKGDLMKTRFEAFLDSKILEKVCWAFLLILIGLIFGQLWAWMQRGTP